LKLLLDTHAIVWWLADNPRLSEEARMHICDPANQVFVSAASAWEIATKTRVGRWPEAAALTSLFPGVVEANGFEPMPITVHHAVHAGSLIAAHGDPFDRMLAAQASLEKMMLITADPAFTQFGTQVLW
jgi:PIN domain nuclease of toxin-antitoxin system